MNQDHLEDSPPILNHWRTWYAVVIGFLIIELILFYVIAKAF